MPLNLAAEASISLLFKFERVRRGRDPALQCMTIGIPNCSTNRNLLNSFQPVRIYLIFKITLLPRKVSPIDRDIRR